MIAAGLPEPLAELLLRAGPILLMLGFYLTVIAVMVRADRKARKALFELAPTLGWSAIRKPFLGFDAVRGIWNGRAAALGFQPAQKNMPAHLTARIDLGRPGRFEIRSRSGSESFLMRPVRIFGPPKVAFFDPADESRYRAWAADRSLVDSLLAIPGVRERLDANLAGGGALGLKRGRLEIRRPLTAPRPRGFRLSFKAGPDLDRLREMAAEEWALLTKLAG